MRRFRISPVLAVSVVAVLALSGCGKGPETDKWIPVSGVIEAVKTEVRAQAQGEIEKILVKEGQKVAAGDLLCTINADKLNIQLAQVRAGIEGAKARRQLARIGTKKELIAVAKNQARDRGPAARDRRQGPAALRPPSRRRGRLPDSEGKGRSRPQGRPGTGPGARRRTTTWPSAAARRKRSTSPRPRSRALRPRSS